MILIDLEGYFACFCLKKSNCSLLLRSLVESPGDLTIHDAADYLKMKVISGTISDFIVYCQIQLQR